MALHRFDSRRDFVAIRSFTTARGRTFNPGDGVDKGAISTATLRRFWEKRIVGYADGLGAAGTAAARMAGPVTASAAPGASAGRTGRVAIPDDWRDMLAEQAKDLAANFTDTRPRTKTEAVAVIEAELARRG